MNIKRVQLKDYRIHVNADIAFDRGINLLLGNNGAGKSSILEALGLALFDADLRSTQADAVRHGCKTATIMVAFQGNDQNEYEVERKIGAVNACRMYCRGESGARIEGKERVIRKVCELSGLEANEKSLFQNVITAYQNRIVGIFEGTNREREHIFNQIFDTAIYRQMYDGFIKDAVREYEGRARISAAREDDLRRRLRDTAQLRSRLYAATREAEKKQTVLEDLTQRMAQLEQKRAVLDERRRAVEQSRAEVKHCTELLSLKTGHHSQALKRLSESEEAVAIIADHLAAYGEYCEKNAEREKITRAIAFHERQERELRSTTDALGRLAVKESSIAARNESIRARLVEIEKERERLAREREERAGALKEVAERVETIEAEGRLRRGQRDGLAGILDALRDAENRQVELEKELARIDEETPPLEELEAGRAAVEKEKVRCEATVKKRHELERQMRDCEIRIREIRDARETLEEGECPFLREPCLNIRQGGDPGAWFDSRERAIQHEVIEISGRLTPYQNAQAALHQVINEAAVLESRIADVLKAMQQRETLRKNRELAKREREIARLKLDAYVASIDAPDCFEKSGDPASFLASLDARITDLRERYGGARSRRDEIERSVDETVKRIAVQDEAGETARREHAGNNGELKRLAEEGETLRAGIAALEKAVTGLGPLRERRRALESRIAELQQAYDVYVSHKQRADECDQRRKQAESLAAEANNLEQTLRDYNAALHASSDAYSAEEHERVREEHRTTGDERDRRQVELATAQTAVALTRKELDENSAIERQLATLAGERIALGRKQALAERFRMHVGSMGRFVAGRLMERIERSATRNFRSITGRGERVRWISTERDSYVVYLAAGGGMSNARRFEALSGGEQVAVALSIRASMASMLTRTHLAIFDEPTVNLDAERKLALAESLKVMLRDLQQAIIVTHDDVFREMAQRIIVLD